MADHLALCAHARHIGDMAAVLQHIGRNIIIRFVKEEFVKNPHVKFQRFRNHAVSGVSHIHLAPGGREARRLAHMISRDIPGKRNQIRRRDIRRKLRRDSLDDIIQRRPVRLFSLFKRLIQDNPLALRSRIVRIAQAQTPVSHGLDAVEMDILTGMRKLH